MNRCYPYIFLFLFLWSGCKNSSSRQSDQTLAKAGSRVLFLSDVEDIFPVFSDAEDSIIFVNHFVDQWIRKTILLEEAENYLPKEMNIDKLVQDYKESLIIHNFEKQIVHEKLDTSVSTDEKLRYYQRNKSSYLLNEPIVRAFYAIVPQNTSEINDFKKEWIAQKQDYLNFYCNKYGLVCSFYENEWFLYSDLLQLIPENTFTESQLKSGRTLDRVKDGNQYFVKVFEFRDKNQEAPLEYIEDKIEKIILYNRKIVLLKNMKQKLYERALELKKVKIYNE